MPSSEVDCLCTWRYHLIPKWNALWWTISPPTCSSPNSLLFVLNQLSSVVGEVQDVPCPFSPGILFSRPGMLLYTTNHFPISCLTQISTPEETHTCMHTFTTFQLTQRVRTAQLNRAWGWGWGGRRGSAVKQTQTLVTGLMLYAQNSSFPPAVKLPYF